MKKEMLMKVAIPKVLEKLHLGLEDIDSAKVQLNLNTKQTVTFSLYPEDIKILKERYTATKEEKMEYFDEAINNLYWFLENIDTLQYTPYLKVQAFVRTMNLIVQNKMQSVIIKDEDNIKDMILWFHELMFVLNANDIAFEYDNKEEMTCSHCCKTVHAALDDVCSAFSNLIKAYNVELTNEFTGVVNNLYTSILSVLEMENCRLDEWKAREE